MILWINNQTDDDLDLESLRNKAEVTINEVLRVENFDQSQREAEVSMTIVGEDEIHKLNKTYRQVDRPTDVLSFPMEDEIFPGKEEASLMLGDIVICLDIAKSQAQDLGHSLEREFMYLICHSTLHLLGFDHIEEADKKIMRAKEKEVMKALGVFK